MPIEPPASAWEFPDPRDLSDQEGPGDLVGLGADVEPGTTVAGVRRVIKAGERVDTGTANSRSLP